MRRIPCDKRILQNDRVIGILHGQLCSNGHLVCKESVPCISTVRLYTEESLSAKQIDHVADRKERKRYQAYGWQAAMPASGLQPAFIAHK
jgi:hypothetical protein